MHITYIDVDFQMAYINANENFHFGEFNICRIEKKKKNKYQNNRKVKTNSPQSNYISILLLVLGSCFDTGILF